MRRTLTTLTGTALAAVALVAVATPAAMARGGTTPTSSGPPGARWAAT